MSIKSNFIVTLLSSMLLISCWRETNPEAAPAGESYRSFTEDGAWCWFSDPRAVYYQNKYKRTYAGWVDSLGSIVIGFYDHDLKKIETRVIHEKLQVDDHNNPSLLFDKDGRLLVFYARHAEKDPIYLARTKNPEDISEWEPRQALGLNDTAAYAGLSNTYTYANICRLDSEQEKLYLFWRGADFKPNFSTSTDNGKNWSKGKLLILPERIYNNRRPYLKVATNNRDIIHFAFTDGHPHNEPTNSIYYAQYKDGALFKANGEKIINWSDLPMRPSEADVVYDAAATHEKAWIWDVAEDEDGNPVIAYTRFPNDSTHLYYYSIWNDGKWDHYQLANSGSWFPTTPPGTKEREPNYSGGIVLDAENPSDVYLSRSVKGVFEIEKWSTSDKGKNWTVTEITRNSTHHNVRPFVIRNSADSLRVLWLNVDRYVHWTDYRTSVKMNIR
jgi:hypothetical protein